MAKPLPKLKIKTLGGFHIYANGKPVATDWPSETIKVFFCSILSPVDLSINWDRICHSLWGVPANENARNRLDKKLIGPLNTYLFDELGINPLIAVHDGIKIDSDQVHVDAFDFYRSTVEGLKLLSFGQETASDAAFRKADSLYTGSFLPGLRGKIITNTREDLESLYRTAVLRNMQGVKSSVSPVSHKMKGLGLKQNKPENCCNHGIDLAEIDYPAVIKSLFQYYITL